MKPARVALGWLGAAAVAVGVRALSRSLDAAAERGGAASSAAHLAGQRCDEATLTLELLADPLELRGTFRASVADEAPFRELHLVAPGDVVLSSVSVDGARAEETTPWLAAVVAAPRAHRRLKLGRRTRSSSAPIEIAFRRGVPRRGGEPLPFVCDPLALVEVASSSSLAEIEVVVPDGVGLLTSGGDAGELLDHGPGRLRLGPWPAGHAPLLFVAGEAETRRGRGTESLIRFVAEVGDLPSAALEAEASEIVARAAPQRNEPPRLLLFRRGIDGGAVEELGGGWYAVAPPREPIELAYALLATSLARSSAVPFNASDPLVAALPAVLVLDAAARDGERSTRLPALELAPAAARGLRAWRALSAAFGARASEAARELLQERLARGAEGQEPALLHEPEARAVVEWALDGVEVRLERWNLAMRGGRSVASGEIVVAPPPPRLTSPIAIALGFVGNERLELERLLVAGERTRFDDVELLEVPRVVVLDPEAWLPHRGKPPVAPIAVAARTFAVAPDASALAVALERAVATPACGVAMLRGDSEGALEPRRWFPTDGPVRALEWIVPGRFLLVQEEAGRALVVDELDGSSQPLRGTPAASQRGGLLLESSERAPGCSSHAMHDVEAGVVWPLPIHGRGEARWVAGSDELVVEGSDGRAAILDGRGRARVDLPPLFHELRELRSEPFGWVASVDSARGGRVELFDRHGGLLRSIVVEGRLRGTSFSLESGALLLFLQAGARDHEVRRVEVAGADAGETVYRGPDRPLPEAATKRGLVLVAAESDSAPPSEPRRLEFATFDALARGATAASEAGASSPRLVCAEAILDPAPVVASAGRYLYYLRAQSGPRGLRGELRPRSLHRYDFLTGREEPLSITGR